MVANASLIACEGRVIKTQIDHQIVCAVVSEGGREEEGDPAGRKNGFVVLVDVGPACPFPGGLQVLIESRVLEADGPVGKRLARRSADEQGESAQVARPSEFVVQVNNLSAG